MSIVTDLFVYPIKSCRAVRVDYLEIEEEGPVYDRQYMLVDESGNFITQRTHAILSQIDVNIVDDETLAVHMDGRYLNIHRSKFSACTLIAKAKVWSDSVQSVCAPDNVNRWFSEIVGASCFLVSLATKNARLRSHSGLERKYSVKFADSAPLLLTNSKSLMQLNSQIANEIIPMERFRPNIVIDGFSAYEEDNWQQLKIGPVCFDHTYPCVRCVITTIDVATGKKSSAEPLATLAKHRRSDLGVCFGMNLIHNSLGRIKIGDPVVVGKF